MNRVARVLFLFCLAMAGLFLAIVVLVPDPFDPDDQAGAEVECSRHAKEIRDALGLYAASHQGHYPKTLKELVPGQLSAVPQCRLAKSSFGYEVVAGQVELDCSWHGRR